MRKKVLWAVAIAALVLTPAIVGLLVVGGDDGRRAAALTAAGPGGGGYQLVVSGLTPSGQAIEVLSYSWGLKSPRDSASGLATGKPVFGDLQIVKKVDSTSPLFVKAASTNQKLAAATLTLYTAGEKPIDYLVYELTDAFVTSVEHSGAASDVPAEQVTLTYSTMQITAKNVDGKAQATYQITRQAAS
jgi:type VI secretion system Hcp family effector